MKFILFDHSLLGLVLLAAIGSSEDSSSQQSTHNTYQPTWDSLDSRLLPEWYDKEKFGIFIHWGLYSTIGYGDWFWLNWIGNIY